LTKWRVSCKPASLLKEIRSLNCNFIT